MKFPSYPKYKDSGVEWLGEVPEHWEVKRLKDVSFVRYGLGEPPEYSDDGLAFIRATDIYRGRITLDAVRRVSPDAVPWSRRPQLNEGEIIIVRSGAYTGDSAIISQEVAGSIVGFDMVMTIHKAVPKFIAWILLSKYMLEGQIFLSRMRAAQPHLNAEELGCFIAVMPPLPEQRTIAAFLDAQTAKIDTLIAKKRELIDKLKEKRAALITRTVTRGLPPEAAKAVGLDPNPRMKDSGVEWLGEVPEHWGVNKFGRHIRWIEQGWSPQADAGAVDEGCWGVLKLSSVKGGSFNPDECKGLPDDVQAPPNLEVKVGDLLITRANTPELVGDVCVVDKTHALRMLCDLIYRVHVDHKRIVTYFAKYFLISKPGRSQIMMDARGTSGSMVKIAQGHIKGWSMPVPPFKEQQSIASFLDDQTAKLDALTAKVEAAIIALQEYRSALITAAVTGKIDVRKE